MDFLGYKIQKLFFSIFGLKVQIMAQNGVKSCDFWWFWSHFWVFRGLWVVFLCFYAPKKW
jgi:hypothetical protein